MSGVDGATKLNKVVAPKSKITETESSVSVFDLQSSSIKPTSKETVKENAKTQLSDIKTENIDIKAEFEKPLEIVKILYEKVFSKSPNFKPEFEETVGDLIFYLSYKLKTYNANDSFDKTFKIENYPLPEKYKKGYIPLALKLAVWCESKGLLFKVDDLLYELSSVFVSLVKSSNVIVNEDLVASAFLTETEFVLTK